MMMVFSGSAFFCCIISFRWEVTSDSQRADERQGERVRPESKCGDHDDPFKQPT